MNKDNGLWFTAGIDTQGFQRDAKKMEGVFSDITKQIEKDGLSVENVFKKMALSATAFFGVQQAQEFVKQIALVRGEFQQLEVAFRVMLGSEKQAVALMNQLVATAAKTPFDLQGVANGAKQLLAFGMESEKINETLVRLGDIAAGLSIPLGDLVYLFGTTMTQGRLYMQDFNQFMSRGIPIADELAKQFGVTKNQVRGLVEEGKIGFPQIEKAINALTSEGGKFSGLMEEQSKTISGQISNIEDAFASMLNAIGKDNEGVINGVLQATGSLIENYETIGKIVGTLVAVYGTYKAALIVQAGVTKALTVVEQQAAVTKALLGHHANMLTAAQYRQIAVTKLLQAAQASLIATMKGAGAALMNPYVLATAAAVGLAYAIYKVVTAESAQEAGVKKANEELKKQADLLEERKNKMQSLVSTIQDTNATDLQRLEAYEQLAKIAPSITNAYTKEEIAALDAAKATREMNAALDSAKYISLKNNIANVTEEIAKYKRYVEQASYNPQGNTNVEAYKSTIQALQAQLAKYNEELIEYERKRKQVAEESQPIEIRIANKDRAVFEAEERLKMLEKMLEEERKKVEQNPFYQIPVLLQFDTEKAREELEKARQEADELRESANKETYQEAKTKALNEYKQAAKARKDAEKKSKAEWVTANQRFEEAEKGLKALGIDLKKSNKTAQEDAKNRAEYKELLRKQEEEKRHAQIDLELETRENLLDAEKETSEKRQKQIELDYDRRIAEIQKQEKKFRDAKLAAAKEAFEKDPKNKGKVFDPSSVDTSLSSAETANLDARRLAAENAKNKALEDIRKEELQSMRDYLMEYGTLEQQRLAIAEEYAEKIAKAQTEGEKAALRVQQAQAEKDIQQKAFDKSFDWSAIFQDLQGHTVEYLTSLRDQLQDVLKNGGLDPEQMAIAQEKLRELNDEISRSGGIFDFVGSRQREQNRREQEAKDAKDALTAALGEQRSIEEELNLAKLRGAPTDKILALEKQLADAREKTAKATALAKEKEDGAKRNAAQAVADWFGDAQQFIAEKGIDQLPELLNSIGLGSLGEKAAQGLSGFNNAAGAAADFASGNYIGAALKGINAVKDFGRMFGVGGGNAAEVQATIDRLTDRNEILTKAIEDLTEELEVNRGAMTMQAAQEAMRYQEEKNQNLKEIAQAQAGYHNAHHSWNSYWNGFSQEFVKEFSQRIGRSWSGDIWELTADEMDKLLSDPYAAELIKGTGKGGYGERVYEKLEDYAAEAEAIEEITKQLNETMTGMSFDGFYNSFIDNLMDMEKSAEDIFDDMAEYYQRAMLSRAVGEKMYEDLEKWYDKYAEAAKSGEGLTQAEIDELNREYKNLINEGIKKRDEIAKITGYGDTFKDAESAAARSIENITSEQANALEGRITAMQIAQEQGNVVRMEINNTLNRIAHPIEKISLHSEELRNIALMQVGHLETISRNTHELFAINEKLGRIEKYTQNLE